MNLTKRQLQDVYDDHFKKQCTLKYIIGIYKINLVHKSYVCRETQKEDFFQKVRVAHQKQQRGQDTVMLAENQDKLNKQVEQINNYQLEQVYKKHDFELKQHQQNTESRIQYMTTQHNQEMY